MKRVNNCFISAFFLFIFLPLYPFAYDRAALLAQRGQWKDAYEKLNTIIVDVPDRADLLYDAGVTAYNLENFSQAAAYFSRAADCADDKVLQAKAHFNAGNALVANTLLSEALDQYQKSLHADPAHEYARHNYARVKQMLEDQQKEQQKQQQEQQEKNKDKQKQDKNDEQQQNNQEKEQQDDRNKQDQSDQDKQQQDDSNKQEKNDHDNQSRSKKNGDHSDGGKNQQQSPKNSSRDEGDELNKESKSEQADEAEHGSKDTERKEHRDKDKHQKQPTNNHERDRDQNFQKESQKTQSKNDTKHGSKHTETPSQESHGSDAHSVASNRDQEQGKLAENGIAHTEKEQAWAQENPWLVDILKNQEERDKMVNKQLMEAKIHQHGGKHGQNCW